MGAAVQANTSKLRRCPPCAVRPGHSSSCAVEVTLRRTVREGVGYRRPFLMSEQPDIHCFDVANAQLMGCSAYVTAWPRCRWSLWGIAVGGGATMTHVVRLGAVRRLVTVVGSLGTACVLAAILVALREPGPQLWRWAAVVMLPILAEVAKVGIRRGASRHDYNWRETALVLGLVLVPPAHLVLGATLGMTIVLLLRRAPTTKIVFNSSVVAIETVLGCAVVTSAHVYSPGLKWDEVFAAHTIALIAVATLLMQMLSTSLISIAVATERSRPLWLSLRDDLRVATVIWARNFGAALVIIASLSWSASFTVLLIATLLGVQAFSTDRAAIREERFAWHRLQVAIDELGDVELPQLIRQATTAAATMMRADAAEIQLDEVTGHPTV